jgi:hypothetical protein
MIMNGENKNKWVRLYFNHLHFGINREVCHKISIRPQNFRSAAFKPFPGSELHRKPSLPSSMQDNLSYYDPTQVSKQSDNVFDGYSR